MDLVRLYERVSLFLCREVSSVGDIFRREHCPHCHQFAPPPSQLPAPPPPPPASWTYCSPRWATGVTTPWRWRRQRRGMRCPCSASCWSRGPRSSRSSAWIREGWQGVSARARPGMGACVWHAWLSMVVMVVVCACGVWLPAELCLCDTCTCC